MVALFDRNLRGGYKIFDIKWGVIISVRYLRGGGDYFVKVSINF